MQKKNNVKFSFVLEKDYVVYTSQCISSDYLIFVSDLSLHYNKGGERKYIPIRDKDAAMECIFTYRKNSSEALLHFIEKIKNAKIDICPK